MNTVMRRDIHVLRYFSSFVSVLDGKVIFVSDPVLSYCPLAGYLYKGFKDSKGADKDTLKLKIKETIESKISEYGFFTAKRALLSGETAIAYGASEMLMFALEKKAIDAAVVVCDGAGTVITDSARLVQGIGARMHSIVMTSPIKEVIGRLKELRALVVFSNALIDQAQGVEEAAKAGYKKIAVTVAGHDAEILARIRGLESLYGVEVTILVVCTTGVNGAKIEEIGRYADIVWSCASAGVRAKIGAAALVQISKQIPVFVLTRGGMDFIAAYAGDAAFIAGLDERKRYLISNEPGKLKIKLGARNCYLREETLPVLSGRSFEMSDA